jgi:hypothetical protein
LWSQTAQAGGIKERARKIAKKVLPKTIAGRPLHFPGPGHLLRSIRKPVESPLQSALRAKLGSWGKGKQILISDDGFYYKLKTKTGTTGLIPIPREVRMAHLPGGRKARAKAEKREAKRYRLEQALRKMSAIAPESRVLVAGDGRTYHLEDAEGTQTGPFEIPREVRLVVRNEARVQEFHLRTSGKVRSADQENIARGLEVAREITLERINDARKGYGWAPLEKLPSDIEIVVNKLGNTFAAVRREPQGTTQSVLLGDFTGGGTIGFVRGALEVRREQAVRYAARAVQRELKTELRVPDETVKLNKSESGFSVKLRGGERFTGTLNAYGNVTSLQRKK